MADDEERKDNQRNNESPDGKVGQRDRQNQDRRNNSRSNRGRNVKPSGETPQRAQNHMWPSFKASLSPAHLQVPFHVSYHKYMVIVNSTYQFFSALLKTDMRNILTAQLFRSLCLYWLAQRLEDIYKSRMHGYVTMNDKLEGPPDLPIPMPVYQYLSALGDVQTNTGITLTIDLIPETIRGLEASATAILNNPANHGIPDNLTSTLADDYGLRFIYVIARYVLGNHEASRDNFQNPQFASQFLVSHPPAVPFANNGEADQVVAALLGMANNASLNYPPQAVAGQAITNLNHIVGLLRPYGPGIFEFPIQGGNLRYTPPVDVIPALHAVAKVFRCSTTLPNVYDGSFSLLAQVEPVGRGISLSSPFLMNDNHLSMAALCQFRISRRQTYLLDGFSSQILFEAQTNILNKWISSSLI